MGAGDLIENLLDLDFSTSPNTAAQGESSSPYRNQVMDLLGMNNELSDNAAIPGTFYENPAYDTFISADAANGFELKGTFNSV